MGLDYYGVQHPEAILNRLLGDLSPVLQLDPLGSPLRPASYRFGRLELNQC